MKKLFFPLIACLSIVMCISFTACEETVSRNDLLGTWSGYDESANMILTFERNNTFTMQLSALDFSYMYNTSGNYTCTASSFVLNITNIDGMDTELQMVYEYEMASNGKSMTIYDVYGNYAVLKKY